MSDHNLRSRLIRLAAAKPELRPHLLPMLKVAGYYHLPHGMKVEDASSFKSWAIGLEVNGWKSVDIPPGERFHVDGGPRKPFVVYGHADYGPRIAAFGKLEGGGFVVYGVVLPGKPLLQDEYPLGEQWVRDTDIYVDEEGYEDMPPSKKFKLDWCKARYLDWLHEKIREVRR